MGSNNLNKEYLRTLIYNYYLLSYISFYNQISLMSNCKKRISKCIVIIMLNYLLFSNIFPDFLVKTIQNSKSFIISKTVRMMILSAIFVASPLFTIYHKL